MRTFGDGNLRDERRRDCCPSVVQAALLEEGLDAQSEHLQILVIQLLQDLRRQAVGRVLAVLEP